MFRFALFGECDKAKHARNIVEGEPTSKDEFPPTSRYCSEAAPEILKIDGKEKALQGILRNSATGGRRLMMENFY